MRVGDSGSELWGARISRRRDFREHLGAEHLPPAAAVATGKCNARHYKVRLENSLLGSVLLLREAAQATNSEGGALDHCGGCSLTRDGKVPLMLTVFHRTTKDAAAKILQGGFRDITGRYLTDREWSGVWVSDRPLDNSEGASGEALLQIDIAEDLLAAFEWVERASLSRMAGTGACSMTLAPSGS